MQILELSNIDINVDLTLLSSDIEFLDDKTALISLKFEVPTNRLHGNSHSTTFTHD